MLSTSAVTLSASLIEQLHLHQWDEWPSNYIPTMILCMFNCAYHQCTFYLHTLVRGLSQGHGLALLDS